MHIHIHAFLSLHLALEFAVCPHRILQIKYVDVDVMLFYENDRLEYKLAYRKKTGENGVENWRKSQDYSDITYHS